MMTTVLDQGSLVQLEKLTRFFNEVGETYYLVPGDTALLLTLNEIDTTVLAYGEVLYCHTEELAESKVAERA